nr:hypothetical protein [Tanacetum cinerariifolium]
KICQQKEFLCIHDDVDDLIESALISKLLLINSNSQRLDKKEQEVKNVEEQPAGRRNPKDVCSPVFTTFSNPFFKDDDDLDSSDEESLPVQDGNSQQEEIDIVTETDDVLPSSIENFADDPE